MSICEALPRSIYGLTAIRYAALRAARYVPQRGTLWTDNINKRWYVRSNLFLLAKTALAPGFPSRRNDGGVPQAPFCTPGPTCSLTQKFAPAPASLPPSDSIRSFAVSKSRAGKGWVPPAPFCTPTLKQVLNQSNSPALASSEGKTARSRIKRL